MLLTVAFPGNQQGHDVTESLPWVSDQTLCVRHVTVPFFFFLVQIQSGCIISYLCLVALCIVVVHLQVKEPLTWFSWGPQCRCRENGKRGLYLWQKKTCKTRSSIYHCRNLNHYCAKCEERTSLLACNRT